MSQQINRQQEEMMKHEWTIKKIESELNTLRAVLENNKAMNRIDSTAAMLIADRVHPTTLADETNEERSIKHRVQDAFAVLEATKPFGQEAVDRERRKIVDRLISKVTFYEQKAPRDQELIIELEASLSLLKSDQQQAVAA